MFDDEEEAPRHTKPVFLRFPTGNGNECRLVDLLCLDAAALKYGVRALAREGRYGGLLPGENVTYSVLAHSLCVSEFVIALGGSSAAVLLGQVHDLPEGLGLRDIPSPVKKFMRAAGDFAYDELHDDVMCQVTGLLNLPSTTFEDDDMVKRADKLALLIEQNHFQDAGNILADYGFTDERVVADCLESFQDILAIFGASSESTQVALFFGMLESNKRIVAGATIEEEASLFCDESSTLADIAVWEAFVAAFPQPEN